MTGSEPARRPATGFTLLEVMAAVAILGVLYVVLATSAMQTLAALGESRRRLEASLLADKHLATAEEPLSLGTALELGERVEEVDIFLVTVDVREVDLALLGLDLISGDDDTSGPSILGGLGAAEPSSLREIQVRVAWDEGDRVIELVRTTYGFDQLGLDGLFSNDTGSGSGDDDGGSLSIEQQVLEQIRELQ